MLKPQHVATCHNVSQHGFSRTEEMSLKRGHIAKVMDLSTMYNASRMARYRFSGPQF